MYMYMHVRKMFVCSMPYRAADRVQRFLIQKHMDTGYFVFGGRMFNSLQDVIDRYQQEEILEGLRLSTSIAPVSRIAPHYLL